MPLRVLALPSAPSSQRRCPPSLRLLSQLGKCTPVAHQLCVSLAGLGAAAQDGPFAALTVLAAVQTSQRSPCLGELPGPCHERVCSGEAQQYEIPPGRPADTRELCENIPAMANLWRAALGAAALGAPV